MAGEQNVIELLAKHLWPLERPPKTKKEIKRFLYAYSEMLRHFNPFVYFHFELKKCRAVEIKCNFVEINNTVEELFRFCWNAQPIIDATILPDDGSIIGEAMQDTLCFNNWEESVETQIKKGEFVFPIERRDIRTYVYTQSGCRGWVSRNSIADISASKVIYPENRFGSAIAEAAESFIGVPYAQGKRSEDGMDCSGLVCEAVLKATGLSMMHFVKTQAQCGALVSMRQSQTRLHPGDLLYFMDRFGVLYTTGISIGGSKFIHAAYPTVRIESINPDDPEYSKTLAMSFAFAKRLFIS